MASKKYSDAYKAVVARMASGKPVDLYAVKYPNQGGFETPEDKPWARLSFIPAASTNVASGGGDTWIRRNGLITIDVFTPKGSGINVNQDICEQISDLFENAEFGNVKTDVAQTAKISDDPWLGYQVNINFYCEGL